MYPRGGVAPSAKAKPARPADVPPPTSGATPAKETGIRRVDYEIRFDKPQVRSKPTGLSIDERGKQRRRHPVYYTVHTQRDSVCIKDSVDSVRYWVG